MDQSGIKSSGLQVIKSSSPVVVQLPETFDLMTFGLFDKGPKPTAGMRQQSTLRREKVADESIGGLMELWEMRKCGRSYFISSETRLREV